MHTMQQTAAAPSYTLDGGDVDEPAVRVRRLGLVRRGRASGEHVRVRLLPPNKINEIRGGKNQIVPIGKPPHDALKGSGSGSGSPGRVWCGKSNILYNSSSTRSSYDSSTNIR